MAIFYLICKKFYFWVLIMYTKPVIQPNHTESTTHTEPRKKGQCVNWTE